MGCFGCNEAYELGKACVVPATGGVEVPEPGANLLRWVSIGVDDLEYPSSPGTKP